MTTFVRCVVKARQTSSATWSLTLSCPALPQGALCTERLIRLLSAADDPTLSFPLPPEAEVQVMDHCLPHYALCCATDPRVLHEVYERLWRRDPMEQDVVAFGGYLYATLLGDAGWQALWSLAGGADLELALCWPSSDWILSRLPWELMSDAMGKFLVMYQRPVAITRLVPAAGYDAARDLRLTLEQPLRVLFVIGAAEDDPGIRPGAECLGLLARLCGRDRDLSLNSHILVRASSQEIEDELASFRPSVVHFICHGSIENHQGYLRLMSDEKTGEITLGATELSGLLTHSGASHPPIVVLNACYSASVSAPDEILVGRAAQENASLAAELVSSGLPIVIAMGGEIADHACRIFTWRFYETLLTGGCVIRATTEGRWVGITHQGAPTRSIDWACPTLFMSDHVSSNILITDDAAARTREQVARDFLSNNNPPFFCDRLEIVEQDYKQLLAFDSPGPKGVLVIEARQFIDPEQQKVMRHGRSRLLTELAARTVRDGHIPCLIHFNGPRPRQNQEKGPPTTLPELIVVLMDAIYKTWTRFELAHVPGIRLLGLLEELLGLPVALPMDCYSDQEDARDAYRSRIRQVNDQLRGRAGQEPLPLDLEQVGIRLRKDLRTLALAVRGRYPDMSRALPVVLLDDVHRFDAAAGDLLALLSRYGLGSSDLAVPVILSFFSAQYEQPEYSGALRIMQEFLHTNRQFVIHVLLQPFAAHGHAGEPYLPYQQYLLHYTPPLVCGRKLDQSQRDRYKQRFFLKLHSMVKGMPSRLALEEANDDVAAHIDAARDFELLENADNEDILKAVLKGYSR
jgi:hypothetical protein